MVKVIRFKTCAECPILHKSFANLCIEIGGTIRGHKCYMYIYDINTKHSKCPYPEGIIIRNCGECLYQKDGYCSHIRPRSAVPVPLGEISKECPLEGYDCQEYPNEDRKDYMMTKVGDLTFKKKKENRK